MSPPADIIEFETIDSTNSEAHRRAGDGARGPLWIRAGRQEQGRGRSGRVWSSPPGNLSATFMFVPTCPRAKLHELSFVAGLAGHDAIVRHLDTPAALQLKWPNDLLIDGAKAGGILVESCRYGEDTVVMIGMGINVTVAPDVGGRLVTHMNEHGTAPEPAALLQDLAQAMDRWIGVWDDGNGFAAVRHAWLERAHQPGRLLTVSRGTERLEGVFRGLGDNGALMLELGSGEILYVEHGDVALGADIPAAEINT